VPRLHLRPVALVSRASLQDCSAILVCELLARPPRSEPKRTGLVSCDELGHPADELQRQYLRADPVLGGCPWAWCPVSVPCGWRAWWGRDDHSALLSVSGSPLATELRRSAPSIAAPRRSRPAWMLVKRRTLVAPASGVIVVSPAAQCSDGGRTAALQWWSLLTHIVQVDRLDVYTAYS